MERKDVKWQEENLSKRFIEDVSGAIPLAEEQIQMLNSIIKKAVPNPKSFLDLGCGNGRLGATLLDNFPDAKGVFLDFSDTMLDAARERFSAPHRVEWCDYSTSEWLNIIDNDRPFDVVISGFSIHHQSDERKKEIFSEVFSILSPGGIFLNLEHVASRSQFGKDLFVDSFVENMYEHYQKKGTDMSREEITKKFIETDEATNILAIVEDQCRWLTEVGFSDVVCFLKHYELALFGGRKV